MSKIVLVKFARRIGALCVLGVAALTAAMGSAQAQEYPNKPIRVIVPYGAGQATDLMCRVFLEQLKAVLKQNIVIENRPGAATNIGAAFVAKAPPAFNYPEFAATPWLGRSGKFLSRMNLL